MKKVFSMFLVFANLFLSKSFICLAEPPDEKVTSKKVVTLEKKKKKAEEQKKVEEYDEIEDEAEDPKLPLPLLMLALFKNLYAKL